MITYLIITIIGLLLYFSSDDQRWSDFKAPIISTLRDDNKALLRWPLLVIVSSLMGYTVYESIKPSLDKPLELRQVHPSPPAEIKVFDKSYDLAKLENPVRMRVLDELATDADAAWDTYRNAVSEGSLVYYSNCFYCHGDQLDGKGHFAKALDPLPTDFGDVGTIAQLQESFLFWRISTGGPGLPKGGMPWNSAMPVWHEMLSEEDIWNVITFLYDYVEQVPRMWDQDISRSVSNMKDDIVTRRREMDSKELYQLRCAVCHGENGAGDGPAAEFLYPRPRDFTAGLWKYKTSPGDLPPRDTDLFTTIKSGLEGTSMPGWSSLFTDQQINGLVEVVKRFDTTAIWAPVDAADEDFDEDWRYIKPDILVITEEEPTDGQIPYTEDSIARGKEVFEENCRKCHGEHGRGNITSGEFLEDDWGYRTWPRDLSKPWTWRVTETAPGTSWDKADEAQRSATIRNIYTRVSIGIRGSPMPSHRAVDESEEDAITLDDRWHVSNYTYSLRKESTWPGERNIIEAVELAGQLPASVDDAQWLNIPASSFRLLPNIIKQDRLFTPINDTITVRSLYNEDEIAFLLEINDRTKSIPGGEVVEFLPDEDEQMYSDAIALQFPKEDAYSTEPVEKPLFRHGDKKHHTTIWYWHAGSVEPEKKSAAVLLDASGPNSRLKPRQGESDLVTQASWQDGRWRVLFKRPRGIDTESDDLIFRKGQFIPVSFANWDGNNGEAGPKHTLTPWFWLVLPHETNYTRIYGLSIGSGLALLLGGMLLIWRMRRKRADD
ncbi:MAG: c-type cytochrome [Gammaproteobacteria bacterium]|nr:c-type cytochrome [Gammaproteobacteria bacterium]